MEHLLMRPCCILRYVRMMLAVVVLGLVGGVSASATMLDGYMGLCTAVAAGSCTELAASGYARQPVSFADAVLGVSSNTTPLSFGPAGAATIAGRAVYDAPTGGNLVAVIPLAAPLVQNPQNLVDAGSVRLTMTALAGFQTGRLYSGTAAPASTLGTSADGSAVSAGVKVVFRSGVLTAALPAFDASYQGPVTQVSGFSVATLTNQATYVVAGAGTLATGAIVLPSGPTDGQTFRLGCQVTVTSLAVSPAAGQTLSGAVSTCGPNVGHEWFYVGGVAKTWFMLF